MVHHDVVRPPGLWYPKDRKARGLLNRYTKIEHGQRDNQAVDDRRREIVKWTHSQEPADKPGFQPAVGILDAALELNALAINLVEQACFLFVERLAQLLIK